MPFIAPPPEQRFADRIEETSDGCWVWLGYCDKDGYGRFKVGGKLVLVSRWAYTHFVGPIPPGHQIRHTCDVSSCVNPAHLLTGTAQDNTNDMMERGRNRYGLDPRRGEANGRAKLTVEQVEEIRDRYEAGVIRQKDLANEYGVSPAMISNIIREANWKARLDA